MGAGTIPVSGDALSHSQVPPVSPRDGAGFGKLFRDVDISSERAICQIVQPGLGKPRPAEGSIAGVSAASCQTIADHCLIFLPQPPASTCNGSTGRDVLYRRQLGPVSHLSS
jgi:hypothetical protein